MTSSSSTKESTVTAVMDPKVWISVLHRVCQKRGFKPHPEWKDTTSEATCHHAPRAFLLAEETTYAKVQNDPDLIEKELQLTIDSYTFPYAPVVYYAVYDNPLKIGIWESKLPDDEFTKETMQALTNAKEKGNECRLQRFQQWCIKHRKELTEPLEHGHLSTQTKYAPFAKELEIQCTQDWRCITCLFDQYFHIILNLRDSEGRSILSSRIQDKTPEWVELTFI